MTPIHQLSEPDFDAKLSKPHNPPDSNISREAFDEEYYRLYDEVEAILARHGVNNAYGEGDYYLEPHIADSRGLGLEVTNDRIITHQLISELSNLVQRVDPKWEIYLGSGVFDFGIFISASEVNIWMSDNSSLQLLP